MKNGKSSSQQTGNLVSVVGTFGGVPVSVESYQNEKQALAAYEATKRIHQKVVEEQTSSLVKIDETFTEKTKGCKTSCSGLPRCKFKPESGTGDTFALAVVRGPAYADVPIVDLPYVIVCMDGDLQVTLFEDTKQAYDTYEEIKNRFKGSPTFEEQERDEPGKKSFSVDEDEGPSVMVGYAALVRRGESCQLA